MSPQKPDVHLVLNEEDVVLVEQTTDEAGKKYNTYKVSNIEVVNANGGLPNSFRIHPDDLYTFLTGQHIIEMAKQKRNCQLG